MSSELLSDREQEEALRNWWRENWRWVFSGIVVGFAALGVWNYWQRHVAEQSEAASQAYRDLIGALSSNDKDKVDATIKNLDTNFAGSAYTDQAHLLLAQAHVNGGRFELAVTELQTVAEHSKDSPLAEIAKLRLARVQIQLGHFDEALALLDVTNAGAFAGEVQEIRGDALFAKGDLSGARAAYQSAVAADQENSANVSRDEGGSLQLKLQDLAAATSTEPAVATPAVTTPKPATNSPVAPTASK